MIKYCLAHSDDVTWSRSLLSSGHSSLHMRDPSLSGSSFEVAKLLFHCQTATLFEMLELSRM